MAHYAIINLGGKQYVVKEGENLLVDRLDREEGKTFHPDVLFLGGNGGGELAPESSVTAKVVGHELGPKVRIGKYKPKTGYKRHTGFRASLTRIEVTGIGGKQAAAKTEAPPVEEKPAEETPAQAPTDLPEGYAEMTVVQIAEAVTGWDRPTAEAALDYEREHAKRKGAITALEHAIAAKEES